jgi:hypothetical protein
MVSVIYERRRMPGVPFAVLTILLLGGLLWIFWRIIRTRVRREEASWEQLLARLVPVNRTGIQEVAAAFLDPTGEELDPRRAERHLESRDIWDFIGGIDGLRIMRQNAEVLIDLASYVSRWNPEALVVAEQLRLDANEIKNALSRIERARSKGRLASSFPIDAPRAAAAYYLMTQRVSALYEISQEGRLAQLEAAI